MTLDDVWSLVGDAVRRVAYSLAARRGVRPDEALADAQYHAVCAAATHDPARGDLRARVVSLVAHRLADDCRRAALRRDHDAVLEDVHGRADPDPGEPPANLSPDARVVLELALTAPGLDTPGAVRGRLTGMGWSRERVSRAFREVREVVLS